MVPFAHGEWLAANVPGARAHLYDDEGHISLVQQMPRILDDLVSRAARLTRSAQPAAMRSSDISRTAAQIGHVVGVAASRAAHRRCTRGRRPARPRRRSMLHVARGRRDGADR